MKLKQRKLLEYREFEIVEDGIKVISKSPGQYTETKVDFYVDRHFILCNYISHYQNRFFISYWI